MTRRQRIAILGSTGSVGTSTLDVIARHPDRFEVWGLSGNRRLDELVLDAHLEERLRELAGEISRWPSLDESGISRRQRVMFVGPPGCGKSSAAEGLASELGWPLASVRLDAIVSSYLGETAANLRRILDFAQQHTAVVLFDEFDALGKERGDPSDHGEFRRVVAAVLQMIEQYRGRSLIVAATNHSETLDSALWRRFDEIMEFPQPSTAQIKIVLRRYLMGSGCPAQEIDRQAARLKGLPFAAAEKVANDARRKALLESRTRVSREDLVDAATEALRRPW